MMTVIPLVDENGSTLCTHTHGKDFWDEDEASSLTGLGARDTGKFGKIARFGHGTWLL